MEIIIRLLAGTTPIHATCTSRWPWESTIYGLGFKFEGQGPEGLSGPQRDAHFGRPQIWDMSGKAA